MFKKILAVALVAGVVNVANATVISFDGGVYNGATIAENTNTIGINSGAYVEDGVRISVTGGSNAAYLGDYYGRNNNVLHWHGVGSQARFEFVSGVPFDLISFLLTSNTESGGGMATGRENVSVVASNGNSFKLPSNGWGNTQVDTLISFNPALFSNITYFTINDYSNTFCLGIDNLTVTESKDVPEPASLALLGLGLAGLAAARKRRAK